VERVSLEGDLAAALGSVLKRLIGTEGLDPAEVVVLTPRSASRSALAGVAKAGGQALTWGEPVAGAVRCSSIHGFKGLESDVVVLVECDQAHRESRDALMYVAVTRARHQVVVIGELPAVS
jgi:superfamily I DNA/RNA helicase